MGEIDNEKFKLIGKFPPIILLSTFLLIKLQLIDNSQNILFSIINKSLILTCFYILISYLLRKDLICLYKKLKKKLCNKKHKKIYTRNKFFFIFVFLTMMFNIELIDLFQPWDLFL